MLGRDGSKFIWAAEIIFPGGTPNGAYEGPGKRSPPARAHAVKLPEGRCRTWGGPVPVCWGRPHSAWVRPAGPLWIDAGQSTYSVRNRNVLDLAWVRSHSNRCHADWEAAVGQAYPKLSGLRQQMPEFGQVWAEVDQHCVCHRTERLHATLVAACLAEVLHAQRAANETKSGRRRRWRPRSGERYPPMFAHRDGNAIGLGR